MGGSGGFPLVRSRHGVSLPLYFPDFRAVRASRTVRKYSGCRLAPSPSRCGTCPSVAAAASSLTLNPPSCSSASFIQAGAIVGDSKLDRHDTRCLHAVSWCERACQHPVDHPARMHYIELLLEAIHYHEFLHTFRHGALEHEVSTYEQNLMPRPHRACSGSTTSWRATICWRAWRASCHLSFSSRARAST